MKSSASARLIAVALVILAGTTVTGCEVPTTCESAIGLRWLDEPVAVRVQMQRIAWRESRYVPTARNGQHYGCLQIATTVHAARIARLGFSRDEMLQPWPNAVVAYDLWREQGFRPWQ